MRLHLTSGRGWSRLVPGAAGCTATTGSIGSSAFWIDPARVASCPSSNSWRSATGSSGAEYLTVAALEPNRALVLSYNGHGMEWVWQFGLYPLDGPHTRLVSRG